MLTNTIEKIAVEDDLNQLLTECDTVEDRVEILYEAYSDSLDISNSIVNNWGDSIHEPSEEVKILINLPYKILNELKEAYEVSNWLNGTTYSFDHIKIPQTLQCTVSYSAYKKTKFTRLLNKHPILKNKRLKKLNVVYPGFDPELDNHEKIDTVEWDEFIKDEPSRIPLLIVNRANLWPKTIPFDLFFEKDRIVALLEVPLYTNWINGCDVYKIPASFNYNLNYNKTDYEMYKL